MSCFKVPLQFAKHALVHNNTGTIILHLPLANLISQLMERTEIQTYKILNNIMQPEMLECSTITGTT
jgi:hypothetical protein